MIFTSTTFLFFFPIFFLFYWFVFNRTVRQQNVLILIASYIFYAWWDFRFLFLLIFSTLLDFYSGIKIARADTNAKRKYWLLTSVIINLGVLVYFKYCNFFIDSLVAATSAFGINLNITTLNIVLPVGISFYTFHGLSYVFDIYNRKISVTRYFVDYAVFVCFFPLLVAGPIERATHLLPEFHKKRFFNYALAVVGMRQILWGLFKKVVIADNCAEEVDNIFTSYSTNNGAELFLGMVLFSVQIYADFSGYSEIAAGLSRLLGFEIIRNFSFPYFSNSIVEFWKKWHISLTSWFRDYLYIPLGGSKVGLIKQIRNVFIVFLVSGFWHGANWTFIIWGLLHALFFLPSIFMQNKSTGKSTSDSFINIIITNLLVMVGWVFFRSPTIYDAFNYLQTMILQANKHPFSILLFVKSFLFWGVVLLFVVEWYNRKHEFGLSALEFKYKWNIKSIRILVYFIICFLVIINLPNSAKSFIYFQF